MSGVFYKVKVKAGGVIIGKDKDVLAPRLNPCLSLKRAIPSFTNTLFLKLAFMRIASLLIAIILPAAAFAATPYGTVIPNTATATY
ncbi:MAG: hypothetical protein HY884_08970, partial [Deltaproteobacteria bacterium]|nr:hypothetical protein [Deltaproteobacteria bacterium]